MQSHPFPILLSLLLAFVHTKIASAVDNGHRAVSSALDVSYSRQIRNLKAARTHSSIKTRSLEGCLTHDIALHYIDEETHRKESQFAALVQMSAKLPTIVLEEVEHHLEDIVCTHSSIQLHFATQQSLALAYEELGATDDFFVVTSHKGCNTDGERRPYRASGMKLYQEEQIIVIATSTSSWKQTVHSVTLDFGRDDGDFEIRQHKELRPRQAAASSTIAKGAQSTIVTASATFSTSWSAQTILPPDFAAGFSSTDLLDGFILECLDCSIAGDIELSNGYFTANTDEPDLEKFCDDHDEACNFYDNGYVELLVKSFDAHIELETIVQQSETLTTYTSSFPILHSINFHIPFIVNIDIPLSPYVYMGVAPNKDLNFTYGFDAIVNDSYIQIGSMSNFSESTRHGFSTHDINALPFQSHNGGLNMTFSTGFSYNASFSINFLDSDVSVSAAADAYFDLPRISVGVVQVTDVDSQCNAGSSSDHHFTDGDVINIIPSVVFDAAFEASAQAQFADLYTFSPAQATYAPLSTSFSLSSACLQFDSKASTYGTPSEATATATAMASGATLSTCIDWKGLLAIGLVLASIAPL